MTNEQQIKSLNNEQLLASLEGAFESERKASHRILLHLKEVRERMLYAERGFSSMFDMLVRHFRQSESSANQRLKALDLMMEVPQAEERLKNGELNMTNLAMAQRQISREEKITGKKIDAKEKAKIVEKIANKTQKQAELELFQALPEAAANPQTHERRVSGNATRVSLTLPDRVKDKLKRLQEVWAHVDANMDYVQLIERAVDIALDQVDPQRRAEKRLNKIKSCATESAKQNVKKLEPKPGRITYYPVELDAALWARAGTQCEFVDEASGRRCTCRSGLQREHRIPIAMGGKNELSNMKLYCPMAEIAVGLGSPRRNAAASQIHFVGPGTSSHRSELVSLVFCLQLSAFSFSAFSFSAVRFQPSNSRPARFQPPRSALKILHFHGRSPLQFRDGNRSTVNRFDTACAWVLHPTANQLGLESWTTAGRCFFRIEGQSLELVSSPERQLRRVFPLATMAIACALLWSGCNSRFEESAPGQIEVDPAATAQLISLKEKSDERVEEIQRQIERIRQLIRLYLQAQNLPNAGNDLQGLLAALAAINYEMREAFPQGRGEKYTSEAVVRPADPKWYGCTGLRARMETLAIFKEGEAAQTVGAEPIGAHTFFSAWPCTPGHSARNIFEITTKPGLIEVRVHTRTLAEILSSPLFQIVPSDIIEDASCEIAVDETSDRAPQPTGSPTPGAAVTPQPQPVAHAQPVTQPQPVAHPQPVTQIQAQAQAQTPTPSQAVVSGDAQGVVDTTQFSQMGQVSISCRNLFVALSSSDVAHITRLTWKASDPRAFEAYADIYRNQQKMPHRLSGFKMTPDPDETQGGK